MSINEEYLEEQKEQIKALLEKYKENTYMIQRLQFHLSGLPNLLENEHKGYEKRVERINQLSNEQKIFMQVFLSLSVPL
jgi:predicted patatin/cPLA2 family phospholipase